MRANKVEEAVLPFVVPPGHSLHFSLVLTDVGLAVGGLLFPRSHCSFSILSNGTNYHFPSYGVVPDIYFCVAV